MLSNHDLSLISKPIDGAAVRRGAGECTVPETSGSWRLAHDRLRQAAAHQSGGRYDFLNYLVRIR
jgi:hypothetical protein